MLIVGMTGCGKTRFLLNMIEIEYPNVFDHIVIVCPTLDWNTTYQDWRYLSDSDVVQVPCDQESVDTVLGAVSKVFKGSTTMVVVDDCASSRHVKKRTSELIRLAISARHYGLSVVVVTQQMKSIARAYRENISRLVTFYNPSKSDMKAITDDYLSGVTNDEVSEMIHELRSRDHATLDIRLRHPYSHNIW